MPNQAPRRSSLTALLVMLPLLTMMAVAMWITPSQARLVNSPPVAVDDHYDVHGAINVGSPGVLGNDYDPDGDNLYTQIEDKPTLHGYVRINNGDFGYRATDGYVGVDSFTYQVCDSPGLCSTGTVTINVINRPPITVDDFYDVPGGGITVPRPGYLGNDSDPDHDNFFSPYYEDKPTDHGYVHTGNGDFGYTATLGYVGSDSFTYTACDSLGLCSTGTVNLFVHGNDDDGNAGGVPCNSKVQPVKTVGKPVNVTNGNMYLQETDYVLPGVGEALEVTRTYNSSSQRINLFGLGWSTAYDEAITIYNTDLVRLYLPDGRAVFFSRTGGAGAYSPVEKDFRGVLVQNGNGSFTLTFKDGRVHQFNAAGKLLSLADRNNNQTLLSYDTGGKLLSVTDPFGRVLTVASNASGRVLSISDSLGAIATYTYGTGNVLLSATYPDGSKFQLTYGTANSRLVLTTVQDALGNVLEAHNYDGQGRATTSEEQGGVEHYTLNYVSDTETDVTDALSHVTKYFFDKSRGRNVVTRIEGTCGCGSSQLQTWTYDNELNILTKTNALNQTTTFTYDTQGNQLTRTDAIGTNTYTYNSLGQVLTATDPLSGVTTNTYSAQGNLLTTKDALNNTTTLTYNGRGQVLTVTDALNHATTLGYNTVGNLQQVTDAQNHHTNYAYDVRGRVTSMTDALNHATAYEYDLVGRLKKITRPDNSTITTAYDLAGRRTQVTDALNHSTTYAYDGAYRVTSVTDALNHATSYTYDLMSNLTARTDALGQTTNYEYDDFNRLKQIMYPAATAGAPRLTELVGYDAVNNVTSRTDTAGHVTAYEYDAINRLKKVTDAANQITQYEYNARSQLTEVIDALSQHYTFAYDALGRVTQQTRGGHAMTWAYNAVGNRTSRTDYNGATTTYAYDNLNRLTGMTYPGMTPATYGYDALSRLTTATNPTGTVSFAYDALGRVASTTDVWGQEITYGYDEAGNRLSLNREHQSVTYEYDAVNRLTQVGDSSGTASYTYNAVGQPLTRTLPNGVVTSYEYNGLSQLKQLVERRGTSTFITRQYGYNNAGQINQVTESESVQGNSSHAYGYDAVNRLTSALHSNQPSESYAYDAVGNRSSSHQESSYSYDPFNQLTATASGWEYSYDANGNQVSKLDGGGHGAEWQYTWDSENRLTQVQLPFGESVSYQYDALGRRVQRSSTLSGETQYTYDGQEVLLDTLADGNTVEYLNGPGIDNKLAVNDSKQGMFYLLHDQLGSVRAVTDAAGMAIDHASSDSFGQGVASGVTRYAYTGREWDEDAGLYYYRARWYDQQQGRFISEDPIGFEGGINLYVYVENGPISFRDPFGLDPELYFWGPIGDSWGHVSIRLDDGTYISYWPSHDWEWTGFRPFKTDPPRLPADYAKDKKGELNREPERIPIPNLDQDAVRRWWNNGNGHGNWSMWNNCSDIAGEALRQGGVPISKTWLYTIPSDIRDPVMKLHNSTPIGFIPANPDWVNRSWRGGGARGGW